MMKTLFTAEAISKGGRSGTIQTPDQLFKIALGNPLQKSAEQRGHNPELLFASAYFACYHGALNNVAKKLGAPLEDSTVRALVSLIEDFQGGYRLAVELHAELPGVAPALAPIHHGRSTSHLSIFQSPARRYFHHVSGGLFHVS